MGTIKTTYNLSKDLIVATATGKITANDHWEWIKKHYGNPNITSLILWDFREADLSALKTDDILNIVKQVHQVAQVRTGGKTAFVVDEDLNFGLSRMIASHSEINEVPFDIKVFRSLDEAKQWLGI